MARHKREPSLGELHGLVDFAPDGIFLADISGRLTFVNEAGCRLLGYSRRELVGKTIIDLIPADDVDRLLASKEQMLRGSSHVGEWKIRRKDGTWIPVEVHANILPQGRWQGFARDISERKRFEAQRDALLKETESRREWLQTVFDTLPLGMLLLQPDGRLAFNSRTEELLGMRLSPTGGSAQYVGRILFPDGSRVRQEELATSRVLRDGVPIIAEEYRVERPDGSRIPVLSSVAPIRGADGRVVGAVGAFQDISERMRMEQTIRTHEHLLQGIFDILPVGVWIADKTGRIVSNNPAGEHIWKGVRYVTVPEFGQYKGWWLETGKPIAADEWALARAVTKGETSTGELVRIQCFDGSFKTIINSAAPLRDENGDIAGAIVVNEDITALQQAQEQLRAAVHDREQILAIVSHDLRNPLSGLMMVASAIEQQARKIAGGEPVRELAASMANISRRMSGLVDDLLAVAVARTSGASMLRLRRVTALSVLEKAAAAARPLVAKAGLELTVEAMDDLPRVYVDTDRVLRVFENLVDNALKFTSRPGRITLAAEKTTGGVRFSVANSGAALPDDQRSAMFQPFWQARLDRRGAGLGLSICRALVEAHGGSIWAEPAVGQRVRVCVLLPSRPALISRGASGGAF